MLTGVLRDQYAAFGVGMRFWRRTGSVEHKVTAGFDYAWWRYDSKFFSGAIAPINIENPVYGAQPTGVFLLAGTRDIISSYGLFAQDQMTLLPKLKAVVGGRFD